MGDVIAVQVHDRLTPERQTEKEVMRYVCSAHTLGISLEPDQLGILCGDPPDLTQALACLSKEHMITENRFQEWIGLHELRSEIVATTLHAYPPPTEEQTFARLLRCVRHSRRRHLIVQAAVRGSAPLLGLSVAVGEVLSDKLTNAGEAADLLEALDEADGILYARECLKAAKDDSIVDIHDKLLFAYMQRFVLSGDGLSSVMPAIQHLANQFPEKPPPLRATALCQLPGAAVVAKATAVNVEDATRLVEATEDEVALTSEEAATIWDAHRNCSITAKARLLATLVASSGGVGADLEATFRSVLERASLIAADHPNGLTVSVSERPQEGVVVTLNLMLPTVVGNEDAHQQAVDATPVIFNLCPEIDVAEVKTLAPDGHSYRIPIGDDRELTPADVWPSREFHFRERDVRLNQDFTGGMKRLLAAPYWTDRLRALSRITHELIHALDELPVRLLNLHDNPRRKREWVQRIQDIQPDVAHFPFVPTQRCERDVEDFVREAIKGIATAINQLPELLDDRKEHRLRGIASQFLDNQGKLKLARQNSYHPRLVSAGDPLPVLLDVLLGNSVDLLFALAEMSPGRLPKAQGESWWQVAEQFVQHVRDVVLQNEKEVLESQYEELSPVLLAVVPQDDAQRVRLVDDRWLVLIDIRNWSLLGETPSMDEEQRQYLSLRTHLLVTMDGSVVPLAGLILGDQIPFYPMKGHEIVSLARSAHLGVLTSPVLDLVNRFVDRLLMVSRIASVLHFRSQKLGTVQQKKAAADRLQEAKETALEIAKSAPHLAEACTGFVDRVMNEIESGGPFLAGEATTALRTGGQSTALDELYSLTLKAADSLVAANI